MLQNFLKLCVKGIKNEEDANNIKYAISQMEEDCRRDYISKGFYYACIHGHTSLVNLLLEYGANDFNLGLEAVCYGGHLQLAEMLIEKGADEFEYAFLHACCGYKIYVIKFIHKHLRENHQVFIKSDRTDWTGRKFYMIQITGYFNTSIQFGNSHLNDGIDHKIESISNVIGLLLSLGAEFDNKFKDHHKYIAEKCLVKNFVKRLTILNNDVLNVVVNYV